jgi:hypothetical protein
MTEMVKPLQDMIPLGKYQRIGKLLWTTEGSDDVIHNRIVSVLHQAKLIAFQAAGGLYQSIRVAMGLKEAGPYFLRTMQNNFLTEVEYVGHLVSSQAASNLFGRY